MLSSTEKLSRWMEAWIPRKTQQIYGSVGVKIAFMTFPACAKFFRTIRF